MLLIAGELKTVLELKHVHRARVTVLVRGERQPESAAFAHDLVEFLEPPVYRPVIGVAAPPWTAVAYPGWAAAIVTTAAIATTPTATIPTAVIHVFIRVASCDRTSLGLRWGDRL